ncbi:FecR family protein [Chitinophaga varians]|uniref:FecR family protein n=1 Tax=Chitinophaga varians TaxID=2202339 RepID=UPI00165F5BE4|nr:FecR family protein [Chitinophaga varians]MBC9914183.1 FecR domain-containing protein [Chitinophaga varians]
MSENDFSYLVHDEQFINYCLQRNAADVQYWEERLRQDPVLAREAAALQPLVIALATASQQQEARQQWQLLQQQLGAATAPAPQKKNRIWYRIPAAAAVLALLLWGIYAVTRPTAPLSEPTAVNTTPQDIPAGGDKATLTLANGSRIVLDDTAEGTVASQGGISIHKTSNGQLVYTITGNHQLTDTGYNTIQTPKGGQYQVNLPDGSKVWLNAATSLTFPAAFGADGRTVHLNGEAYFEVAATPHAQPFTVKVNDLTIDVLGTQFNIMAYADEKNSRTTLLTGAVRVTKGDAGKVLQPGQQAIAGNGIQVRDADTEAAVAWKNGMTVFSDADIHSIMRQIARWYDVEIVYQGEIPPRQFTGKIPRHANVSKVLKILELSNIHFTIDGRKIIVTP